MANTEAIKVIGIGDDGLSSLLPQYVKWIEESDLLIGGARQLSFFPGYKGEKLVLGKGLSSVVDRLIHFRGKAVVLASGDPLFYGIGGYLSKKLNHIEIYPYLSSLQLAFSRIGESWNDAYVTSVHGRSMKGLAQRIDGKEKIAILTDEDNSPNRIAQYLQAFGMEEYRMFVAENIGGPNEKTGWYSLSECIAQSFSPLNLVILRRTGKSPRWSIGIPDEEFAQRKPDKGLITKKEIRVLSLAQMNLQSDSIVWDIGTCTGSVAIEAAKIARDGAVYAIEKNEVDIANCLDNMHKFRTDFTVVHAKAPQGLEQFPSPDAVFLGGTGGEMRELLHQCCSRLNAQGRIVLNAATIENLNEAVQMFGEEGFHVQVTMGQISRSKQILNMNRFEALNPVFIVTATRKDELTDE